MFKPIHSAYLISNITVSITLFGVLVMHGWAGWMLMRLKPIEPSLIKVSRPIEIKLVIDETPPEPTPELSKSESVVEPEPIVDSEPQSAPKPEPKSKLKQNSVSEPKPAVNSSSQPKIKPITTVKPEAQSTLQAVVTNKAVHKQQGQIQQQEQARLEQVAREGAEQESRAKAERQAIERAEREEKEKAEKEAKERAERETREKAEWEAEEAKRRAEQQAKSNEPIAISASEANASWLRKPRFSFPDQIARRARSGERFMVVLNLTVDKQGSITQITVSQSSGNHQLDREAVKQVRQGKFNPFMRDGVPRIGTTILPISYKVP